MSEEKHLAENCYSIVTAPEDGAVRRRIFLNGDCVYDEKLSWRQALYAGHTLMDQAIVAERYGA